MTTETFVSGGHGTVDVDEVRARHPERVIRRNGLTWEAVDPTGLLPTVGSGRLDFLEAMLGTTGTAPTPDAPVLLELEITGICQLRCAHCYAGSGPDADPGTMTLLDWERVVSQAAALGVRTVQFIGGEPTLDPALPRLIRHALAAGLNVQVYSNLVHITPSLWRLFSTPGVSLGTSWYAADAAIHGKITGSRASYARTSANIAEAVRRGIPVRAAIVEVLSDQDTAAAAGVLHELGVTDIRIRPQQNLGRAARDDEAHDLAELCGGCGDGRAAVMTDGSLVPCVIGRWLDCGNVRDATLADILSGPTWQRTLALVPRRHPGSPAAACPPASDGNDCPPASNPTCSPSYCAPDTGGDDVMLLPLVARPAG